VLRQNTPYRVINHDPALDLRRGDNRLISAAELSGYFTQCIHVLHPIDQVDHLTLLKRIIYVVSDGYPDGGCSGDGTEQAFLRADKQHPVVQMWCKYPDALRLCYNAVLQKLRVLYPKDLTFSNMHDLDPEAPAFQELVACPVFLGDPTFITRCLMDMAACSRGLPQEQHYHVDFARTFALQLCNPSTPMWYDPQRDAYVEYYSPSLTDFEPPISLDEILGQTTAPPAKRHNSSRGHQQIGLPEEQDQISKFEGVATSFVLGTSSTLAESSATVDQGSTNIAQEECAGTGNAVFLNLLKTLGLPSDILSNSHTTL